MIALAIALLTLSITPFFARSATLDYLSGYRFLYFLLSVVTVVVFSALCLHWRKPYIVAPLICAALAVCGRPSTAR